MSSIRYIMGIIYSLVMLGCVSSNKDAMLNDCSGKSLSLEQARLFSMIHFSKPLLESGNWPVHFGLSTTQFSELLAELPDSVRPRIRRGGYYDNVDGFQDSIVIQEVDQNVNEVNVNVMYVSDAGTFSIRQYVFRRRSSQDLWNFQSSSVVREGYFDPPPE